MTDERAADQAQYLRIVAFDSEVRHEGGFSSASKASEAASFSQSRNECYLRTAAVHCARAVLKISRNSAEITPRAAQDPKTQRPNVRRVPLNGEPSTNCSLRREPLAKEKLFAV